MFLSSVAMLLLNRSFLGNCLSAEDGDEESHNMLEMSVNVGGGEEVR